MKDDMNYLSDESFESMVSELISMKFQHQPSDELERKPKADKGV